MLRFRVVLGGAVFGAAAGFAACAGTSGSDQLGVVTGIVVRAETLTTGRGCGVEPTQVFKYAILVYGKSATDPDGFDVPLGGGVYDCFTDGTFVNLPVINGSATYRLDVRVFNKDAYEAASTSLASLTTIRRDAGAGESLPVETAFSSTRPTWTTRCTATQFNLVQSLAVCEPILAVGDSRVTLQTSSFALASGGFAQCVRSDAGTDAGDDAGDAGDDAGDAGDAGDDAGDAGDAGAPPAASVTFRSVSVRTRTQDDGGTVVSDETVVPCGTTFVATFPPEPQTVAIDAILVGEGEVQVGTTTCSAVTSPSTVVPAACDPVF